MNRFIQTPYEIVLSAIKLYCITLSYTGESGYKINDNQKNKVSYFAFTPYTIFLSFWSIRITTNKQQNKIQTFHIFHLYHPSVSELEIHPAWGHPSGCRMGQFSKVGWMDGCHPDGSSGPIVQKSRIFRFFLIFFEFFKIF